jgi:GTP-binding protein
LAKPVVVMVGRQNVGKSTLLNRVAGKPLAIVEDLPGTTRDRLFADAEWNGIDFTLVDTGGLEFKGASVVAKGVRKQAEVAIAEADVIVFLADAKEGIMPLDQEIANILRKTKKPVIVGVNKVDNQQEQAQAAEFHRLGFSDVIPLSAFHGRGVAELLDKVVSYFPEQTAPPEEKIEGIKIAIVGHPHVGKSLLLNTLLGKDRTIVGDTPGTTRDAIDSVFDYKGQTVILIDTAGIRRKGKVDAGIEFYSVLRSMQAIDRADITLLVVDATEPVTAQDTHIAGYIDKAGKGIILLINKWDLVTEKTKEVYNEYVRDRLKFAPWVPVLFISALVGTGIKNIMPMVLQIQQERSMRIADEAINTLTKEVVASHNLPRKGQKILQVFAASQTGINPPTFRFTVNDYKLIHFSYERFLENKLREVYGFNGTPIRLVFKSRG